MTRSKIEWTDRTWNPVRGCSRVSDGCRNCYAERQAARFSGPGEPFEGFAKVVAPRDALDRVGGRRDGWTGRVELIPEKLAEPLRWRKPSKVFVNSMSDLFHESLPFDAIDRIFAVMALAPQHTFQVLTKRPERMRQFMIGHRLCYEDFVSVASKFVGPDCDVDGVIDGAWGRYHDGLPNLRLGVSVEDQPSADARLPHLVATPAAKRFVSYEPALGPVDFSAWLLRKNDFPIQVQWESDRPVGWRLFLDWLIVGGESGPGARPCNIAWIRSAVAQCKAAGVPVFVKQLGANPWANTERMEEPANHWLTRVRSRKGNDPSEWPEDMRVREVPT